MAMHFHIYITGSAKVSNSWSNHQIPKDDCKIILAPKKYSIDPMKKVQALVSYQTLLDIYNQKIRIVELDIDPSDTPGWTTAVVAVIMYILTSNTTGDVSLSDFTFTLYHDDMVHMYGQLIRSCLTACGYGEVSIN